MNLNDKKKEKNPNIRIQHEAVEREKRRETETILCIKVYDEHPTDQKCTKPHILKTYANKYSAQYAFFQSCLLHYYYSFFFFNSFETTKLIHSATI